MPDQGIIILCIIVMVVLFFLVQIFLSWRSSFVWGLLMPACFLMIWLYVALDMSFLSFLPFKITLNQLGRSLYIAIGILGMLLSLAVLVCCRIGKKKYALRKEQEREERRLERQQRLAAEAAMRGEGMSAAHQDAWAEQQHIEEARRLAYIESAHQAEELAEKKARKQRPHHHHAAAMQEEQIEQTLVYHSADDDSNHLPVTESKALTTEFPDQPVAVSDTASDVREQQDITLAEDAVTSEHRPVKTTANQIVHQVAASCQNGAQKLAVAVKAGGQKLAESAQNGGRKVAGWCRRGVQNIRTIMLPKLQLLKEQAIAKAQQVRTAQIAAAEARAQQKHNQDDGMAPLSPPQEAAQPPVIVDEDKTIISDEIDDEQDEQKE